MAESIQSNSPLGGCYFEMGHAPGAPALEVYLAYDTARALVAKLQGDPAWEGFCRGLLAELRAVGEGPIPPGPPEPEAETPAGRCAGCAFWRRYAENSPYAPGPTWKGNLTSWGGCERGRGENGTPVDPATLAWADDMESYGTNLHTHETFGCVQYEAVY